MNTLVLCLVLLVTVEWSTGKPQNADPADKECGTKAEKYYAEIYTESETTQVTFCAKYKEIKKCYQDKNQITPTLAWFKAESFEYDVKNVKNYKCTFAKCDKHDDARACRKPINTLPKVFTQTRQETCDTVKTVSDTFKTCYTPACTDEGKKIEDTFLTDYLNEQKLNAFCGVCDEKAGDKLTECRTKAAAVSDKNDKSCETFEAAKKCFKDEAKCNAAAIELELDPAVSKLKDKCEYCGITARKDAVKDLFQQSKRDKDYCKKLTENLTKGDGKCADAKPTREALQSIAKGLGGELTCGASVQQMSLAAILGSLLCLARRIF